MAVRGEKAFLLLCFAAAEHIFRIARVCSAAEIQTSAEIIHINCKREKCTLTYALRHGQRTHKPTQCFLFPLTSHSLLVPTFIVEVLPLLARVPLDG